MSLNKTNYVHMVEIDDISTVSQIYINVPFTANRIVCQAVSFRHSASVNDIFVCRSDLVDNMPLFSISNNGDAGNQIEPKNEFLILKNINGLYRFQFNSVGGSAIAGRISITLIFYP